MGITRTTHDDDGRIVLREDTNGHEVVLYVDGTALVYDGSDYAGLDAALVAAFADEVVNRRTYSLVTVGSCPRCRTSTPLAAAPGGGVRCEVPGCGYWFCY